MLAITPQIRAGVQPYCPTRIPIEIRASSASGRTTSTRISEVTRHSRPVERSSGESPMIALSNTIANAADDSSSGVSGSPDFHRPANPVTGSATRNSSNAPASTGASTENTTITSRWSVPSKGSRSRNTALAAPNAAPAIIHTNQPFSSSSRSSPMPIAENNWLSRKASRKLSPVKATLAPPMIASVQA